jgi:hypothetical protein
MTQQEYKGLPIEEFQGSGAKNRFGAIYVKSLPILMFVPVILLVSLFAALDLIDYIGATLFFTILLLFILAVVGAIMVLDHSIGRSYTKIVIYSNGVDMKPSWIERLKKLPRFVVRADIEKGVFRRYGYAELIMREGRKRRLGSRGLDEVELMAEVLRSRLNIAVESDGYEVSETSTIMAGVVAAGQTISPNAYCNGCGSKLDKDEAFCIECGRKR